MIETGNLLGKILSVFDNTIYELVSGFISAGMTRFMIFITFWGSELAVTILTVMILLSAFIFKKKKYLRYALLITVNIIIGALLNFILKQLFQRQRPDLLKLVEISGYSFPSGHSMSSMIFYGFIIFLCLRYAKHWSKHLVAAILSLLVFMIGISRIYLGVHYASDVLGGFIIGLAWLVFYIRLAERFGFLKRKEPV
ncbi:MAG: phosphatase PAP2 family protein [Clostridiaceae bacterium]